MNHVNLCLVPLNHAQHLGFVFDPLRFLLHEDFEVEVGNLRDQAVDCVVHLVDLDGEPGDLVRAVHIHGGQGHDDDDQHDGGVQQGKAWLPAPFLEAIVRFVPFIDGLTGTGGGPADPNRVADAEGIFQRGMNPCLGIISASGQ